MVKWAMESYALSGLRRQNRELLEALYKDTMSAVRVDGDL